MATNPFTKLAPGQAGPVLDPTGGKNFAPAGANYSEDYFGNRSPLPISPLDAPLGTYNQPSAYGDVPASDYSNFTAAPGSTSTLSTVPRISLYGGKEYDLNDPAQRDAFFAVKSADADKAAGVATDAENKRFEQERASAADQYGLNGKQLDNYLLDEGNQEANYARDYDSRVVGADKSYRVGSANRGNAFAAMSPDAFQSAQADEQGMADKAYGKEQNAFTTEKGQQADTFSRARDTLGGYKHNLEDAYNAFGDQSATAHARNLGSIADTQNQNKASDAATLLPIDAQQNGGTFSDKYKLPAYTPSTVAPVDTSQFASAGFSGLPGQGGATGGNPFANIPAAKANPVQTYLDTVQQANASTANQGVKKYLYGATA